MEFVKSLVGGRSRKEQALRLKEEGNKYFGALEFAKAVESYTKGIDLFPLDDKGLPAVVIDTNNDRYENGSANVLSVLFSNRSAAHLRLGKLKEALADALLCIKTDGSWSKGYVRKGKVLYCLKRFKESADAYQKAYSLEASCRKVDRASHDKELDNLKKQNEANSKAYMSLLEEKKSLEYKLEDYSALFGVAGKKAA